MSQERRFADNFRVITGTRDHSFRIEVLALDSISCKVHPDGYVALKKFGEQAIGKSRGGWNTKLYVVFADDKVILEMHLSSESRHDAPEGRVSIAKAGEAFKGVTFLMDRAYEGNKTRSLAASNGHEPIIPPKSNRNAPWGYDKEKYKRRNVVERLFRRLKELRRVCARYDKTDIMFLAIILFAFVQFGFNSVNMP